MMAYPILINRPLVVAPLGVKLCRLSDAVLVEVPVMLSVVAIAKRTRGWYQWGANA